MSSELAELAPLPLLAKGQNFQCVGGCGKTQPVGTDEGWETSCCGSDVMIWDESLDGDNHEN
tara:strand:+ start:14523 stop:14708 length:186 start_codon:yes stop_codon:yes gene_type:complete